MIELIQTQVWLVPLILGVFYTVTVDQEPHGHSRAAISIMSDSRVCPTMTPLCNTVIINPISLDYIT